MKLAIAAFVTALGLGGIAEADPAFPAPQPAPAPQAAPPGPVVPMAPAGPAMPAHRGPRPPNELHEALMRRFDRNHDGVLDAQERRHAIRALRRLARRMAIQERGAERSAARRDARMRRLVERYDRNGDGVVGPDEMPPGVANRLRRLDKNGDGWLDDRDR